MLDNRHVVRLFDATEDWFRFDRHDVWTMFHSVAFDFSVWEIWGALMNGGRLVVVPQATTRSPDDFRSLVAAEGVTVLNQTPSAFRQFIEADLRNGGQPLSLRFVVFGEGGARVRGLRPWFERHGDRHPTLVNMYGITETTVHVTYRPLSVADLGSDSARRDRRTDPRFALLRRRRGAEPRPDRRAGRAARGRRRRRAGLLGALRAHGAALLGRSFTPGGRVYRSGDLVRRLASESSTTSACIDQQVKVRGFRIETAEVEAALRRSGLIRDVSVLAAKKGGSETVLVAYVVSDSTSHELRSAARAVLPEVHGAGALRPASRDPDDR